MILLLSGASGSGKTSACAIAARTARARGIDIGGLLCGAIFEDGRKVGIECTDLASGPDPKPRLLALARLTTQARSQTFDDTDPLAVRYGMWEFDKATLASADGAVTGFIATLGDATLGDATLGDADRPDSQRTLVFIDEIGPLELERGAGMIRTLAAIDEAALEQDSGTVFIVVARPDIAAALLGRWPYSRLLEMGRYSLEEAAGAMLAAVGIV